MDTLLREIGEAYYITIDEMEVSVDQVHIFCSYPLSPRCLSLSIILCNFISLSIKKAVSRLKILSARAIFREFPQVKRRLWGGEFWEDGYFARTVGDKVTADVVRRYILAHRDAPDDGQLNLF